uniref:Secreted protein n=1 Tax=Romanomermis culicivorax TaxID=13658 RepID=A0A915IXS5_ROMCU
MVPELQSIISCLLCELSSLAHAAWTALLSITIECVYPRHAMYGNMTVGLKFSTVCCMLYDTSENLNS